MQGKFKILGGRVGVMGKQRDEILSTTLSYKLKDNNLLVAKMRKKRNWLRKKIEDSLGSRSCACRAIVEEVKKSSIWHREQLKKKNKKKTDHLVRKYGMKRMIMIDDGLKRRMGNPRIFDYDDMVPEDVKDPVIVEGIGEKIELNEDEMDILRLGPKFCLYVNLCEEEFETDLEEAIIKIKWDLMSDDKNGKPGEEDIALRIVLGRNECDEIDEQKEEEERVLAAETKNPFDRGNMTFNYAKRRATDMKANSRVHFPSKARPLDEESALETLRMELKSMFKYYVMKNCGKGGSQKTNLTKAQEAGLKSLKKRVKEGDLIIIPTDKSGNLAVMSRRSYYEAGMKHTKNDLEVGWDHIKESQKELNGHVSMCIKFFKMGKYWEHTPRIRETTMGEGLSICPLSLLFKDHKGWKADSGTAPPTRPVVGGHLGINLHLSEIVSDVLEPVVSTYEGGKEIISCEDMLARTEILNEETKGWSRMSFWKGMTTEEYRACQECEGDDEYVWDSDTPEVCSCDDGVD